MFESALSVRDFRSNLSACLDRAKEGEQVVLRRGKDLFTLVSVPIEDVAESPALQTRIAKARQDILEGKGVQLNSKEDLVSYLESL